MHQPTTETEIPVTGPRAAVALYHASGAVAQVAGALAALALLLLTFSIILGIVFRFVGINNTWTYDFDIFTLLWLAFVGAAWTARENAHVTAGIALEQILGHRGRVLTILRFVIIAGFLVLFAYASYNQMLDSFHTHERTLDVVEWPLWVPKAALPLGAIAWIAAELHKLLRQFLSSGPIA